MYACTGYETDATKSKRMLELNIGLVPREQLVSNLQTCFLYQVVLCYTALPYNYT